MGYLSRVRGAIKFSPPLSILELRNNPVLSKYEEGTETGYYPDLELCSQDRINFDTIECSTTDAFKAYEVENDLTEIVTALPDRTFSGRLEIYGEEQGDISGYRVKNGKIEQIEPTMLWPEG